MLIEYLYVFISWILLERIYRRSWLLVKCSDLTKEMKGSMVFESELSKEEALFFKMIAADDSKEEILVSDINALFQDWINMNSTLVL